MTADSGDPPGRATIRLAVPDDAEGIAEVHVRSWQATYVGVVPQAVLDQMSVERRAAFWRETVTRSLDDATDAGERVWVAAREGGGVAGFASIGPARDRDLPHGAGELFTIYVAPESLSAGIGRRLLEAAVGDLTVSHDPLVLWVLTDNERARRFYEAAGWHADGAARMLDFDGTQIEEIRYRRTGGGPA